MWLKSVRVWTWISGSAVAGGAGLSAACWMMGIFGNICFGFGHCGGNALFVVVFCDFWISMERDSLSCFGITMIFRACGELKA